MLCPPITAVYIRTLSIFSILLPSDLYNAKCILPLNILEITKWKESPRIYQPNQRKSFSSINPSPLIHHLPDIHSKPIIHSLIVSLVAGTGNPGVDPGMSKKKHPIRTQVHREGVRSLLLRHPTLTDIPFHFSMNGKREHFHTPLSHILHSDPCGKLSE